jgi:non-specific serine/threonine protein kinase
MSDEKAIQELLDMDAAGREHLSLLEAQFSTRAGVIPFVGAGFSVPYRFPQWDAFLNGLAAEAGTEAETKAQLGALQYEEAAGALLRALGQRRFQDKLAASFGDDVLEGQEISGAVAELLRFPPGPIITTNFERVIESAFARARRKLTPYWHSYAGKGSEALQQDRPFLLKLHGDWEHPTTRVLTLDEYRSAYGDASGDRVDFTLPLPTLLFKLLTTRCCLFLGCSLKQDRTMQLLRSVARDIPDLVHYAIVEKPRAADEYRRRAAELSAQNIRPVWYPPGRHDLIQPLLTHLARQAALGLRRLADGLDTPRVAGTTVPNNIPQLGNATIGRESEIEHLREMLRVARLVTITGPGGCGKSRLAIETAAAMKDRYDGGVWIIPLADLARKADREGVLPSRIGKVIGVAEQAGRPPHESLAEHLATGRFLLVLDNAEHLISSCRSLASYLLPACPDLTILATSRRPITLPQERLYPLAPLAAPDPEATDFAEIAANESVKLFVARARERSPSWDLKPAHALDVARLCRELDGIPLAIEVAAARLGVQSVETMAAHSQDLLLALGNRPTGDLRTWTLRAALRWSYGLLRPVEQRFMRAMTVFDGGWTAESAEAVFGDARPGSVLDLLQELHDHSLVVSSEHGGVTRFRYLEPIRQVAQLELRKNERDDYEGRHAAFFLQFAENAAPHLLQADQAVWLDRLNLEVDNFRAATRWSVATRNAEHGLRLMAALWRFVEIRGYFTEGRVRTAQVLDIPGVEQYPAALSKVLSGAGMLSYRQADFDDAREKFTRSLELEQRLQNDAGIANALNDLGIVATMRGDLTRARDLYAQSLAIEQRNHNPRGVAVGLFNLGFVELRIGAYDEARRLLMESLEGFRQDGNERESAFPLNGLGLLHVATGQIPLALEYAGASLEIRQRLKDVRGTADSQRTLGWAAIESGDVVHARARLAESLTAARGVGDRRGIAETLEMFGLLYACEGRAARAVELFAASDQIRRGSSPPLPALASRRERALTAGRGTLGQDQYDAAWRRGTSANVSDLVDAVLKEGQARV